MANRLYKTPMTSQNAHVILSGVIQISSAAAITAGATNQYYTVAKTGTGQYTVTLRDKYVTDVGIQVALYASGTKALWVRVQSPTAVGAATPTFIIETVSSAGAPTDNTTSAIAIAFTANLNNSSVAT